MHVGLVLGVIGSLPLLAVLMSQWSRGWSPTGDDAIIALRSFDVFTRRMPLVGHVNQAAAAGQAVYDPGPLQNWALAVPVRLFAFGGGALFGTVIVAVVALITGIIATQRTAGRGAAMIVAAGALIGAWSTGPFIGHLVWNPASALIPFVAAALCGWAVATGSLRWWPAVVVFASYSVQAHLMYAPSAIAIVVLTPILGVLARRRISTAVGKGWAIVGVVMGAVCWSGPVIQQLTHRPGNLTLLWRSTVGSSEPGLGFRLGLNHLARTVAPNPAWLHSTSRFDVNAMVMSTLHGRGAWGVAALVVLGALVLAAAIRRDERVLGLTAIALVVDLGAIWVVAGFPREKGLTLTYVSWLFWPAGMLTWFAYGYTAVRWGRQALARVAAEHPDGRSDQFMTAATNRANDRLFASIVAVVVAVACVVSVFVGLTVDSWTAPDSRAWQSTGFAVQRIANVVGARKELRRCRIDLSTEPIDFAVLEGITYQMVVRGGHPAPGAIANELKPWYQPRPGDPAVVVTDTVKRPVDPHAARLGVVTARDPDGIFHRYVISLTAATPANRSHHGAAC